MDWSAFIDIDQRLLALLNGSHSLLLDNLALSLTCGWTWLPLYVGLFYLVIKNNETMSQILLLVACTVMCVFLSGGIDDLVIKPFVGRWRPTQDPMIKYTIDVVNGMRETQYGFFSAHAANTFSIAVFFSLVVKSRLLSVALVLWSLVNCWTRVYLGVHYPGDIIAGLLWGGLMAGLSYYIYRRVYKKISPNVNYVSSQYTKTGYSRVNIDVIMILIMCSCCYAVIHSVIV